MDEGFLFFLVVFVELKDYKKGCGGDCFFNMIESFILFFVLEYWDFFVCYMIDWFVYLGEIIKEFGLVFCYFNEFLNRVMLLGFFMFRIVVIEFRLGFKLFLVR